MRSFFETQAVTDDRAPVHDSSGVAAPAATVALDVARVAIYDAVGAAPRLLDISSARPPELIERVSSTVYDVARGLGGSIPYTVVREITENLIHAGFREVVVSVLDGGDTLRFADQGPGILDKERALIPGFTTASSAMKQHIRGVGSGLPIVDEYLRFAGGRVEIEDNLGKGTVVTVSLAGIGPKRPDASPRIPEPETPAHEEAAPLPVSLVPAPRLTNRHKQVLFLVLELGTVGPAVVARELGVALSTAYRDLEYLETAGLLKALPGGKRRLTDAGSGHLETMFGK